MRDGMSALGWCVIIGLGAVVIMALVGGFGLGVMPWRVQQETAIYRASNSYLTTQQSGLRTLRGQYDDLAGQVAYLESQQPQNEEVISQLRSQMAGIRRQMREIADLIPGHVQSDIQALIQ